MDPAARTCRGDVPGACQYRERAIVRGEFYYDFAKQGWFWTRAHNPHRPWRRCPWCDEALASPRVMRQRADALLEEILGPVREHGFDAVGLEEGEG